jgi:hypothetical protein
LNFSGEIVWTNRDYPFYGQHGLATSPLLHGELLIMARTAAAKSGQTSRLAKPWDQSYLLTLDAKTGKALKGSAVISIARKEGFGSTMDGRVISEAGDVVRVRPQNRERLWSSGSDRRRKSPFHGAWRWPCVHRRGQRQGNDRRSGLAAAATKETNLVWEQRKGMPKAPSMTIQSHLFAIRTAASPHEKLTPANRSGESAEISASPVCARAAFTCSTKV